MIRERRRRCLAAEGREPEQDPPREILVDGRRPRTLAEAIRSSYAGSVEGVITAVQEFKVRVPDGTPLGFARFQLVLGSATFDIGDLWVRGAASN